ncbi:hypothetical protein RHMOL_Rhmol13G0106900 [Rhododendron molle]|uniref:Uncharacterized protein n=1 Tax=Rhododendron molle TaxID=49168 RepID=A0ACC0L5V3_RHOML|nr:hypothetical protein RHMOL_Rhmol13G0106900 [Rhododendron molle]
MYYIYTKYPHSPITSFTLPLSLSGHRSPSSTGIFSVSWDCTMEAEPLSPPYSEENRFWKGAFAVVGIMSTLVIYGVLQEKIMTVPYGEKKEYFKYSLFLVFCNRLTTSAVSAGAILASKKALDPVAPVYKYCLLSVSNIVTTTCQYEALKYVSFPVQTLAKCAKMIPVMIWSTAIMQKVYKANDYFLAFLVMIGCALFILYPATGDNSPYNRGRESTVWGASLMIGYLGDILTEGLNYTFLTGLILQGDLLMAIDFVGRHSDCFFDVALLSTVATASQFFISYTIRTFGALTFATIMTTRQAIVFGSLYAKSFLRNKRQKPSQPEDGESIPLKGKP